MALCREQLNRDRFHTPQEADRILGEAINICRNGQIALHGGPEPSHNPPNIAEVQSKGALEGKSDH